jgi:hypothetical protein
MSSASLRRISQRYKPWSRGVTAVVFHWGYRKTDIHFIVEESPEGGFTARGVEADIFTEGDTPSLIRLHITREEARVE